MSLFLLLTLRTLLAIYFSSDIIIDDLKTEESRSEDSVAITWVTYRVRKNRLKDNIGSSSRLDGPVQMNAMTDRDEG